MAYRPSGDMQEPDGIDLMNEDVPGLSSARAKFGPACARKTSRSLFPHQTGTTPSGGNTPGFTQAANNSKLLSTGEFETGGCEVRQGILTVDSGLS